MLTVTVGKANVGVAVIVGVSVTVEVNVIVGVFVSVNVGVKDGVGVNVGTGVSVQEAAVPVSTVEVCVACCSGEGAQAERHNRINKIIR